jgi:hypothetical protein
MLCVAMTLAGVCCSSMIQVRAWVCYVFTMTLAGVCCRSMIQVRVWVCNVLQ